MNLWLVAGGFRAMLPLLLSAAWLMMAAVRRCDAQSSEWQLVNSLAMFGGKGLQGITMTLCERNLMILAENEIDFFFRDNGFWFYTMTLTPDDEHEEFTSIAVSSSYALIGGKNITSGSTYVKLYTLVGYSWQLELMFNETVYEGDDITTYGFSVAVNDVPQLAVSASSSTGSMVFLYSYDSQWYSDDVIYLQGQFSPTVVMSYESLLVNTLGGDTSLYRCSPSNGGCSNRTESFFYSGSTDYQQQLLGTCDPHSMSVYGNLAVASSDNGQKLAIWKYDEFLSMWMLAEILSDPLGLQLGEPPSVWTNGVSIAMAPQNSSYFYLLDGEEYYMVANVSLVPYTTDTAPMQIAIDSTNTVFVAHESSSSLLFFQAAPTSAPTAAPTAAWELTGSAPLFEDINRTAVPPLLSVSPSGSILLTRGVGELIFWVRNQSGVWNEFQTIPVDDFVFAIDINDNTAVAVLQTNYSENYIIVYTYLEGLWRGPTQITLSTLQVNVSANIGYNIAINEYDFIATSVAYSDGGSEVFVLARDGGLDWTVVTSYEEFDYNPYVYLSTNTLLYVTSGMTLHFVTCDNFPYCNATASTFPTFPNQQQGPPSDDTPMYCSGSYASLSPSMAVIECELGSSLAFFALDSITNEWAFVNSIVDPQEPYATEGNYPIALYEGNVISGPSSGRRVFFYSTSTYSRTRVVDLNSLETVEVSNGSSAVDMDDRGNSYAMYQTEDGMWRLAVFSDLTPTTLPSTQPSVGPSEPTIEPTYSPPTTPWIPFGCTVVGYEFLSGPNQGNVIYRHRCVEGVVSLDI